jgi:hypothetical protein
VQTPQLFDLAYRQRRRVGLIAQPDSSLETWVLGYRWWAADNGCYSKGDTFDPARWLNWLNRCLTRDRCLFVVCPDVFDPAAGVGDPDATWARSERWFEVVRDLGFPVALALQDGAEAHLSTWDEADRYDAVFIAGSTDWKLSQAARDCCFEAQLLGKWVHVGRVNSWERISHVAAWAVDSVDGTFLKHVPPHDRQLAGWVRALDERGPGLFPEYLPEGV